MAKTYKETILGLFELLETLNAADADPEYRAGWTFPEDANQRNAFGFVAKTIEQLAGREILDHYYYSNEVEFSLADHMRRAADDTSKKTKCDTFELEPELWREPHY